ncbi:MAG: 6-bladed beta-propeller, partial [Chitinophagaceae bacterium]|nr:6-bladed beta-propeller [Chitinophagaceae bacterium]
MKRRQFIQQSLLTASGTLLLGGMAKAVAPEDIVFGHGNKRYRLNRQWSKADVSRYPVNDCHEMLQDSKGRIVLLTNETRNNVLLYDKSGKILSSWGTEYPGAHGLSIFNEGGEDVLFICDNNRH